MLPVVLVAVVAVCVSAALARVCLLWLKRAAYGGELAHILIVENLSDCDAPASSNHPTPHHTTPRKPTTNVLD